MTKKAIILDLDNTIYPVSSIGEKLFAKLFQIIIESGDFTGDFQVIRSEIMRIQFQMIANEHHFGEQLKADCMNLLHDLTYDDKIEPFEYYEEVRKLSCRKYLVTTGFTKMQTSKVKNLGIENDFERIFIVDPVKSDLTKQIVFKSILDEYGFEAGDVLVVGDDLNSEIKAAQELGIETVLYDFEVKYRQKDHLKIIRNFRELEQYIN